MHRAAAALLLGIGCAPDPKQETADTDADADADADTGDAPDRDGDGYSAAEDCDDADGAIHPGAAEVCDSIDNDCDGLVDDADGSLDASGGLDAYPDDDQDGYGDSSGGEARCAVPSGWLADGSDCDDTDASVNPGAAEVCDGVNNDCDVTTSEGGTATWVDAAGGTTDWTDDLQPTAAVVLDAPGTLYLCEGEWPLTFSITSTASIVAPAGAEKTILDGRGAGRVVSVLTTGPVMIQGATITGGGGGGLSCEGGAALSLVGVDIRDNTADTGGGVHSVGCEVAIRDSTIRDNTADAGGGGLAVLGGNAQIERTTISDNVVTAALGCGGGVTVRPSADGLPAAVALIETTLRSNTGHCGSGLHVADGAVSCAGDSGPRSGGFTAHSGGLGAVYLEGGSFEASRCDFGPPGSEDDNAPHDVATVLGGYAFDDDASFQCTVEGGCF